MTREQFISDLDRCQQILDAIGAEAERLQRNAQEAAWNARWEEHKARARQAAPPTPAPPPADRAPTYEEIKRAARAPRPITVTKVIDPYVSSPGSTIRMG